MRKYGLIGYPLSHSFSRKYFGEKFESEGLSNYRYLNYPIKDVAEINALFDNDPELFGLNVTIPYKESVIKHLDALSEEAREVHAVNTVCLCRKAGRLARMGHNTDVIGFRQSLEEQMKHVTERALILGTGGSSKAVRYVLEQMNIACELVSSSGKEDAISYEDVNEELVESAHLIVNTTPLGMHPETDTFPQLPYKALSEKHLLFDLVYNPALTLFLRKGKEQGAKTVNGMDMLRYQAEASWAIWMKAKSYE